MNKTKLFCFPYAGGSSMVYSKWKNRLEASIELIPVELNGRGKKYGKTLYDSMDEVAVDIYDSISGEIEESEYALFGHSMGSLIALEIALKALEKKTKPPKHIFFSGQKAPHIKKDEVYRYTLPDDEFVDEIVKLGGTPKELFENPELLDVFLPILRSDFKVVETYEYKHDFIKLPCDITVINGSQDRFTVDEIAGWREHTDKACKIVTLKGGHFFINERTGEVINIINYTLTKDITA